MSQSLSKWRRIYVVKRVLGLVTLCFHLSSIGKENFNVHLKDENIVSQRFFFFFLSLPPLVVFITKGTLF